MGVPNELLSGEIFPAAKGGREEEEEEKKEKKGRRRRRKRKIAPDLTLNRPVSEKLSSC